MGIKAQSDELIIKRRNPNSTVSIYNFKDEINKIFERIGRFYDTSSGRYEAMIVTKNGVDDNLQIREHSFEKLFKAVKQYEKDNFKL